jgi:dinuclear metal center YbgI/SA1388 family protein
MTARLEDVVRWLDAELRTAEITDYPGALNGLQFANGGSIERVVAAVDYSLPTVRTAAEVAGSLLLVHHGMFWGGATPVVGPQYQRIATMCAKDVAVYASHLPLDTHPRLGNNVLLARHLQLAPTAGFARYGAVDVGLRGVADVATSDLVERARGLASAHGHTLVTTPVAPDRRTRRWGVCTGAGASSTTLKEAVALGLDTLVVGEGPHHTAVEARDLDIVVIYAGHYATETLGVRALAADLAARFSLPMIFADEPTGR